MFFHEFCQIFKNTFLKEYLWKTVSDQLFWKFLQNLKEKTCIKVYLLIKMVYYIKRKFLHVSNLQKLQIPCITFFLGFLLASNFQFEFSLNHTEELYIITISVNFQKYLDWKFSKSGDLKEASKWWSCIFNSLHSFFIITNFLRLTSTSWKVSEYGVFSGLNTEKYGLEETPYLDTFHTV